MRAAGRGTLPKGVSRGSRDVIRGSGGTAVAAADATAVVLYMYVHSAADKRENRRQTPGETESD